METIVRAAPFDERLERQTHAGRLFLFGDFPVNDLYQAGETRPRRPARGAATPMAVLTSSSNLPERQ